MTTEQLEKRNAEESEAQQIRVGLTALLEDIIGRKVTQKDIDFFRGVLDYGKENWFKSVTR